MSRSNSLSFRCPVHQSPGAIAHTFNYEPNISIKIDGIFKEIIGDHINNLERDQHYPVFPQTWTKIEGEYYEVDGKIGIFYVFYIESSEKIFENIQQMYEEIENYFIANTLGEYDHAETETDLDIQNDIVRNIRKSFEWRDKNSVKLNGLIWFPKKYWKLDTSSWNNYIDQLDQLFKFINSDEVKDIISHDGLVISPNVPSAKKSLVKLKPIEDLTIDLFFNGKRFFSRERTDYTQIIGKYDSRNYKYGSVYRLAPTRQQSNNHSKPIYKFMPVYEREHGKRANPDNIIADILYKFNNYFQISQLKGVYFNPWYAQTIESGFPIMQPLFDYTQTIYNSVIRQINRGLILDIGCGAMGQYHRSLENNHLIEYVGLDLDMAKLHEAQVKVKYSEKYKFVLMDINHRWNRQNERFPNNIWRTYFHNMATLGKQFDSIISVFSSQYANLSKESWLNYVNEINYRSKSGTKLFIMWINHEMAETETETKTESYEADLAKPIYHTYNSETNTMDIRLPHREAHTEPGLGNEIRNTFLKDKKNRWVIDKSINPTIPVLDKKQPIYSYAKMVDWIVMVKV
jgi:hypothetical protein